MKKISPKNHKSSCHPEFISGSYHSEHTQSLQTCNDERFRMTNFLSRSVNGLQSKQSGVRGGALMEYS